MEAALTKAANLLLDNGVLGLVVVGLSFICWQLWTALKHSQEQRLTEAKLLITVTEANTTALEHLQDVVDASIRRDRR